MVTKVCESEAKKLHSVSNLAHERSSWRQKRVVCGVDEVGRGCLAGPVVAAAVIFPIGAIIDGIDDSKKLSEKSLKRLALLIKNNSWWAIGINDHSLIDSCNIRVATRVAMRRAIANLFTICPLFPEKILIDDMVLGSDFLPSLAKISAPKGESWSYSIAAASIITKVWRDQLMAKYAKILPKWGFNQHKGYGTRLHQEVLLRHETSIIHRNSFLKRVKSKGKDLQCNLF